MRLILCEGRLLIKDYIFRCRVCAMLHDEETLSQPKWYEDVNDWWRGQGKIVFDILLNQLLLLNI